MKQTINIYDFHRAFEALRPDNFTYEGLEALFEQLESLEEDSGEEMELDVIAICCDFAEYTLDELNSEYDQDFDSLDDAIEWANSETWAFLTEADTIILQAF